MNNFNTNKIRKVFSNSVMKAVLISLVTIIITILIIAFVLYRYRGRIFQYLSHNYVPQQQALAVNTKPSNSFVPQENKLETDIVAPIILKPAGTIVDAVKLAKPAVVSIVISKEVPKYDVTYKDQSVVDGSGNVIPGISVTTPVYTQNGTEKQQLGSGSGFIISSNGLIVTNNHVVDQTGVDYTVLLNSGKEYKATVLAKDSILDVALIKITASNLPYLSFADSDKLEVGQSVVAIGNALGQFGNTVSSGVISGLSRNITAGDNSTGQTETLDKVIQTDAAINPGNSGGPLLNLYGEVVGINVARVEGSSNVGFSIPINSVKSVISSFQKTGIIVRSYIGVRYVAITSDIKSKYNLSVDYGIWVQKGTGDTDYAIAPGSPAEKAGLKEGDIILEIGGVKIDSTNNFSTLLRNKKVGSVVVLKVLSAGVEKMVNVTLEQIPNGL
jgi:serine protease Do